MLVFLKKKNTHLSEAVITETESINVAILDSSWSLSPVIGDASWSMGSDFDQ